MQSSRPEEGPDADERESAYELLQRGQDLLDRRHFAQAAIVLERADRLEPGKGSILEALGRAYFNSGQPERSRATFEALLEVDPSSHYGHFALGQSLKRLGRRREAGTHLRLAVALSPKTSALPRRAGAPRIAAGAAVTCRHALARARAARGSSWRRAAHLARRRPLRHATAAARGAGARPRRVSGSSPSAGRRSVARYRCMSSEANPGAV